jgi:error-prone DNA polymerase
MGFYAPAQIVRDAVEHGVEVRPVDVNLSDWDCTLERSTNGPAIRLGFRQAKGLKEDDIRRMIAQRGAGYPTAERLWGRGGLDLSTLTRLAEADAFRSMGLDRRQALWAVRGLGEAPLPLFAAQEQATTEDTTEDAVLPVMPLSQHVIEDYRALQMTLKRHPLAFLRERLARRKVVINRDLAACKNGQKVTVAGLVLVRQRPGTASGVIFMTMEDETGVANVVVWNHMFQVYRRVVMTAKLVACRGKLQIEGTPPHQVIHVVAEKLVDLTPMLSSLREENVPPEEASFEIPLSHADEVTRHPPRPDPRDPANATAVLDIRSRDFH